MSDLSSRTRSDDGDPLACVPGAIPEEDRAAHFALIQRLFRDGVQEKSRLSEGYMYAFAPDDFTDVARFVENERRCCPFLTFSIEIRPAGRILLRLTGPPGTVDFLDLELPG